MIRVLIADDETLVRDALVTLLSMQEDFEVVAQAASGDEAITAIAHHKPDVAVLDLQMPGRDGIEVTLEAAQASPSTRCLIVTSHGRPGHLKRALAAGARGFLSKTTPARVLADVIRQVHDGHRYVDPELSAAAISAGDSPLTPARPTSSNSPTPGQRSTKSPPGCTSPKGLCATTSAPPSRN